MDGKNNNSNSINITKIGALSPSGGSHQSRNGAFTHYEKSDCYGNKVAHFEQQACEPQGCTTTVPVSVRVQPVCETPCAPQQQVCAPQQQWVPQQVCAQTPCGPQLQTVCAPTYAPARAGYGGACGWFIGLLVLVIIVWFILYALNPCWLQEKDKDGEYTGCVNGGRLLLGAIVIALVILFFLFLIRCFLCNTGSFC